MKFDLVDRLRTDREHSYDETIITIYPTDNLVSYVVQYN